MIQYVFPSVYFKDGDKYTVVFPDLNIFTDGVDVLEAFLFAKNYLKEYIKYSTKYEMEIEKPSSIEQLHQKYPGQIVMYVDAVVPEPKEAKL